jgi:hypothetical protein
MGQAWLDERHAEINALLRLYMDQIAKDFNSFRLEREKIIPLAHLSQQQSIDVLELNMQLADVMEVSQIHIDQSIGHQIDVNTSKMEKHVKDIYLNTFGFYFGTPYVKPLRASHRLTLTI